MQFCTDDTDVGHIGRFPHVPWVRLWTNWWQYRWQQTSGVHWSIQQWVIIVLVLQLILCLLSLLLVWVKMCQPVADNAGRRHLLSAACGDLAVPVTRTVQYGPRSFAVTGPSAWNSLPAPLRMQLPPSILVPSWSENRTLHQIVSSACSWLFLAVRAGERNRSTHHHHHQLMDHTDHLLIS